MVFLIMFYGEGIFSPGLSQLQYTKPFFGKILHSQYLSRVSEKYQTLPIILRCVQNWLKNILGVKSSQNNAKECD